MRELQNLTRRLSALYAEDLIPPKVIRKELRHSPKAPAAKGEAAERHIAAYFDAHLGSLPPKGLYTRIMQEVERPLIIQTLKATGGNQIKAAEVLKINRNTLRAKLKTLKINPKAL